MHDRKDHFQLNTDNSHMNAPFTQFKEYDHEDVETEFTADRTLAAIADLFAAFVIFSLLMAAIIFLLQVPERWITNLLLMAGGV